MAETIEVLNPDPEKSGGRIDKSKYDLVRAAMLDAFKQEPEILFKDLKDKVAANLASPLDGSVSWYTTVVKLDLEARGLIERIADKSPQLLRLNST